MDKLLSDKNTYKVSRVDPSSKLQRENKNELFKHNFIDQWEKRKLHCSSAAAPRIYGLPKIHKPNMPLRPIVSSINVPCYGLSKYIGQILRKLVSEKYNIKNSLQLKNNLQNFILDKNETFQVFGMPMGNPLSPTIADIVLYNLLDEALTELREKNIHIKYISKYVDDILAIIKMDEKDEILKVFNSYHTKIQFTIEMEHNKQIAYLDTKLHHREGEIKFDWFSKETSSGRIINFNSTQPRNQTKLIEEVINEIKGKIKYSSEELDFIKDHNNVTAEKVFIVYVKTPIDKQQPSNVVYEIPCRGNNNEPCDLLYIGTTKRNLHTRITEHRMDIKKKKESTALSQHVLRHGQTADFETREGK
ncbi:uncharacterized protein LOC142224885 [Haematobia irritans]|uniref:uncharacterized protein LOC142224885 n=1 Tax=Haematobia irritans TaxID=7368 RepID=UPI003F50945D